MCMKGVGPQGTGKSLEGCLLAYGSYWSRWLPRTFICRMGEMTISRANMNNQITKPPMKKKKPFGMKYGGKTKGMKHGGLVVVWVQQLRAVNLP